MQETLDPSLCPICGQPNQCAMEKAKATGAPQPPCWCLSLNFSAELLSKVPDKELNKACICSKCVSEKK